MILLVTSRRQVLLSKSFPYYHCMICWGEKHNYEKLETKETKQNNDKKKCNQVASEGVRLQSMPDYNSETLMRNNPINYPK